MGQTTYLSAAAVVERGLLSGDASDLGSLVAATLALVAVAVLFSALRKIAQVVAALVAAAAAVGSVVLLVVVFCGLFAAALLLNVSI